MALSTLTHIKRKTINLYISFKVRDGPDENHDLLGRWCGNDIPATVTSTTNNLYIEFRSDADTAGTGFKATYTTGIF